jgi:hypothetical protein
MTRETEINHWAAMARWGVAVAVYTVGCIFLPDNFSDASSLAVLALAAAVFWLLKSKARREQKQRIDAAELRGSIGQ